MNEREYTFTKARSLKDQTTYSKKESELTESEINLLVGTYIHEYDMLPKIVQERVKRFINTLFP